jgi:transcriptional regulator with XRE-family HTH domain
MRVAEEIRVLMVRKRVNQKQLAQRLNVSAMWVSGRLTGQTEIAVNDLPRIASALDVPMAQLLPAEVLGEPAQRRANASGDEGPTAWYSRVGGTDTRRASRPADNRPGGHPDGATTPAFTRTARLPRPGGTARP